MSLDSTRVWTVIAAQMHALIYTCLFRKKTNLNVKTQLVKAGSSPAGVLQWWFLSPGSLPKLWEGSKRLVVPPSELLHMSIVLDHLLWEGVPKSESARRAVLSLIPLNQTPEGLCALLWKPACVSRHATSLMSGIALVIFLFYLHSSRFISRPGNILTYQNGTAIIFYNI